MTLDKNATSHAGSYEIELGLILGVFALAFMWGAFWSIISPDQMGSMAEAADSTSFTLALAVGQVASVATCSLCLYRAGKFLNTVWGTAVLSVIVIAALVVPRWFNLFDSLFDAAAGFVVGLVAGLLWVQAALFLSRVPSKAIAITLSVSSLTGALIIVLRDMLEPAAADGFFMVMIPLSLVLFYLAYRFRSDMPARRHGHLSPDSLSLGRVRDNLATNKTLYVVIFVFALVFGIQVGLGSGSAQSLSGYADIAFFVPGILLLVTYYGFKRSINFRTLCLVVLLSTIVALLSWGFDATVALSLRKIIVFTAFTLFDLSVAATLVEVGSIESTPSAIPMLVGRTFIMAGVVIGMVLSLSVAVGLATQQVLDSLSVVALVAVFALFTLIQQIFNPKRENVEPERPFFEAIRRVSHQYGLSAREAEILAFVAKGYNAQRIQSELTISHNTVKSHIHHIYAKLGVHTQQEAILIVDDLTASIKSGKVADDMVSRQ